MLLIEDCSKKASEGKNVRKGEKTAQRILDVAEAKFAEKGYEKTNLREIAEQVGIQEPGLYRHFANKQQLYTATLERALHPLQSLLKDKISSQMNRQELIELPALVFELLTKHPSVALLFQQSLLEEKSAKNPMKLWIDGFFKQAEQLVDELPQVAIDRQMLALRIVALFNVCIGFFSSRDILDFLNKNNKNNNEVIEKQKIILTNMMESWL